MASQLKRFNSILMRMISRRLYSKTDLMATEKDIKKTVLISQSKDVYANLALEQWLYNNTDFMHHHILLLHYNEPSVVIGKQQNPWLDTNFTELNIFNGGCIKLARRNDDGDALYQDNGSLNLTFFTNEEQYNSKHNMEIISRALFREFNLKSEINSEDNLLLRRNKQASMNISKHGPCNSYHHCSLKVRTNKVNENLAFQKHNANSNTDIRSNVGQTKMMNLCEENPKVNISNVIKAVGWEFLRTTPLTLTDHGMEYAYKQKGFQLVNPTDSWFPGLNVLRDNYRSWDNCYGATPKFNISQTFLIPQDLVLGKTGAAASLKVTMTVDNGKISDILVFVPYGFTSLGFSGEAKVIHNLKGKKFSVQIFEDLEESLGCLLDERDKFVTQCLKQVMTGS